MRKKRNRLKKLSPNRSSNFEIKEDVDYDNQKPIFSFKYMKYNSLYCLSRCDHKDKAGVVSKLVMLSQLSWKEIISESRSGNGFEHMPINTFSVPMPPYVTEDVDRLMVFRFSKVGRFAGQRERDIFHILLVGENLYPH